MKPLFFCWLAALLSLATSVSAQSLLSARPFAGSLPTASALRHQLAQPNLADTARVAALNRLALRLAGEDGLATGQRHAAEALVYAQRIGYVHGELDAQCLVARLAREGGDFALAFKHHRAGLKLAEDHHLYPWYQQFYDDMGATSLSMGDYPYAVKLLTASLQHLRRYPVAVADSAAVAATLYSHLAAAYYRLGRYPLALAAGRSAVATMAPPQYRASASRLVAEMLDRQRPHFAANDSASDRLERAVSNHRREGNVFDEAHAALELAAFYLKHGQLALADGHAARAEALARRVKAANVRAEALTLLAKVATARGDYRAASTWKDQLAAINAALFNQEKAQALATQQAKFEVDQEKSQKERIAALRRLADNRKQLVAAQQTKLYIWWGVGSVLTLVVAVVVALYMRLRNTHRRLRLANEATRHNESQLVQANHEIGEQVREKEVLLHEKEVLLQEIHHRVKNNMQLVSSLLAWQSDLMPDAHLREAMASAQLRIQSMASVHEFLYRSPSLADVPLDRYLGDLVNALAASQATQRQPVKVTTELANVVVGAKKAVPVGLIVTELVINALKHAFRQRPCGTLHVSLTAVSPSATDAGFHLVVADDGVGIEPAQLQRAHTTSLGMQLVDELTQQLNGTLHVLPNRPSGTRFEIHCPRP